MFILCLKILHVIKYYLNKMFSKIPKFAKSLIFSNQRAFKQFSKPFVPKDIKYSSKLDFVAPNEPLPEFRVIDLEGEVVSPKYDTVDKDLLLKIYDTMVYLEEMDSFLLMSQRQGRISFYMTSFGESATTIASAAAFKDDDLIFPQYREQGTLLWRGFTVQQFVDQCIGNVRDLGKGRQMPVHYGSKELHYMTVSSPLATQIPQASGAGYGYRISGQDKVAVTFFGEGAASEGDFHAALNFAATLRSQTLFLCRNNRYAISTPSADQYAGDGIAVRGPSYGVYTLRVDGNDALAVYQSVKFAREYIVREKRPVLIEFMTYRLGDHSTSDHSVLYRGEDELESWKIKNHPLNRLGLYLKKKGYREFDEAKDAEIRKKYRAEVIEALKQGREADFLPPDEMFNDVYDKLTPNLVEQYEELKEHLQQYGNEYKKH